MAGVAKTSLPTKSTGEAKSIKDLIRIMRPEIEKALPSVLTPERFTRMTLTALSTTPELAQCTPGSFLGAMMQAAQLGVEPNTPLGQAYLIPYKNKGRLEAQFQLGYRGLIALAHRNGVTVTAHTVYERDEFSFSYGLDEELTHKPALTDRGDPIAYYACYRTADGARGFVVMSKADVIAHKNKYSKAAGSSFSPWNTNFDSMAKKTAIKQVLKYAPIATEFTRAVAADETIKSSIMPDMVEEPDEFAYIDGETITEPEQETGEA